MKQTILVGISTALKFLGQFLFLKSVSAIPEYAILKIFNLQSLTVLLAGFTSGGVQTFLSRFIPAEAIGGVWAFCKKKIITYFFHALLIITPFFFLTHDINSEKSLVILIVPLGLLLAYTNSWIGLLTGQKQFSQLFLIYILQFVLFLIMYLSRKELTSVAIFSFYPLILILSCLYSYSVSPPFDRNKEPNDISVSNFNLEIKSYRLMGIVLTTAGILSPFLIRNLLLTKTSNSLTIEWDYLTRLSSTFISVTSFFIFTLYASDISKPSSKNRFPYLSSMLLLVSYLTIFYFEHKFIFKILFSRELNMHQTSVLTFVIAEVFRFALSMRCIFLILRGKTKTYIWVEIVTLASLLALIKFNEIRNIQDIMKLTIVSLTIGLLCSLTSKKHKSIHS